MDIFESKNIAPMLIAENKPPFNSDKYIYELKLDGLRALAYLDQDGAVLRNKRNKNLNPVFPELLPIYKQAGVRCILDGEIIIMKNGRPSFSELQGRSLMTNTFKIELAYQRLPASFVAFDILYYDNEQITSMPLMRRKALLDQAVADGQMLSKSKFIEQYGIEFFNLTKEQGLEGIVAKEKDSKYYFGKRTKEWIKCKALLDEDFIVCGYYFKGKSHVSVILGSYQERQIVYRGHVVIAASHGDYAVMKTGQISQKDINYPDFPGFSDYGGAVWLDPELVCRVEFMEYTKHGGLRQPTYRGLRNDKSVVDCKI